MKTVLSQINPIIADVNGNCDLIIKSIKKAKNMEADLIVFPEMCITGYPPMDLLENKKLISDNIDALDRIKSHVTGIAAVIGFVDFDSTVSPGLRNSAAFIQEGEVIYKQHKTLLPTYDVFDEHRYFTPADKSDIIEFNGFKLGITICEDIWNDYDLTSNYIEDRQYVTDPVTVLIGKGADFIINISASPYVRGKMLVKRHRVINISKMHKVPTVYVNQVGGNDSLIFDGGSFAVNSEGKTTAAASLFSEDMVLFDTESKNEINIGNNEIENIENALILGLRDYMRKCGFSKAVVGLSGGIDSALTATIAVKALGCHNVYGITMPSMYSSSGSIDDSYALAKNLGIEIDTIEIKNLFDQFCSDLSPIFKNADKDVTEENIQARIRGLLLMAVSNKTGALLLTTGNKSELAMGYCTLYGDMSGGLAVISDLPKTTVFELSNYINRENEIIPWNTINKPPSAELRPDQKDEDSLPPYEILDEILELYIEKRFSLKDIIDKGFDSEIVKFVIRAVDRNEYKRRQAAPGLKITSKAFGLGRRIPMAQKFRA